MRTEAKLEEATAPEQAAERPVVGFGPELPGWGSWEWLGRDLSGELGRYFTIKVFGEAVPDDCDLLVVIKHPLPAELAEQLTARTALVYCQVDYYGSAAHIDSDAGMLCRCSRIIVHCERLRKYFAAYAPVEYMDHHVKFVGGGRRRYKSDGYIVWVGVRSNLPALVEWVNGHDLPLELRVLTNLDDEARVWRRAGISSFVPPHPGDDHSLWGCLDGLKYGEDANASYRRRGFKQERFRIIQAEVAAGWKPLCLRSLSGRDQPNDQQTE